MTPGASAFHFLHQLPPGCGIHFCGVGGSAMNGMAILLAGEGFRVTGTDPGLAVDVEERLAAAGVCTSRLQDGSFIPPDASLVVATAAVPREHPELRVAESRGIPVVKYAGMLGVLMNSFTGVAVAGTHGKTTTTGLLVSALREAKKNPGFVVGGYVPQFGAGAARGGTDVFVAEACEYDRSFLNLHPCIAIVTNVEADHLDIYENLEAIIDAFIAFSAGIREGGALVYCADDAGATRVARAFKGRAISFGLSDGADYRAVHLSTDASGNRFDVAVGGAVIASLDLRIPGVHNVRNALAAFAAGHLLGCDPEALAAGLSCFCGVARRFDVLGEASGVTVMDDYGHHPTEIRALLAGVKERFPGRRVVAVFQPHQISRTRLLFREFAAAFDDADEVLLPDIYAARDVADDIKVTSERLAAEMAKSGTSAHYTGSLDHTADVALSMLREGDVFVTIGAGNICEVGRTVWNRLR